MDESVEQRPRRRRSSILPRRSIAPPPISAGEDFSTESNITEHRPADLLDKETVNVNHLNRCFENLTSEKEAWIRLRAERKLMINSENRISEPPLLSWDSAQEFLNNEEIEFLKNRPSHDNIYATFDRLVVEAARLQVKYKKTSNLTSSIQHLAKAHLQSIKINIAEYSEKNLNLPVVPSANS